MNRVKKLSEMLDKRENLTYARRELAWYLREEGFFRNLDGKIIVMDDGEYHYIGRNLGYIGSFLDWTVLNHGMKRTNILTHLSVTFIQVWVNLMRMVIKL